MLLSRRSLVLVSLLFFFGAASCASTDSTAPSLTYSSYFDWFIGSTKVLSDGSVLIVGSTCNVNFPVSGAMLPGADRPNCKVNGQPSGVIAKIAPDGSTLEFARLLGTRRQARQLDLDGAGNIYVAGFRDTNEPKSFLIKLDADATVLLEEQELPFIARALAVDKQGGAHVAFNTDGSKYPIPSVAHVATFSSSGEWVGTFDFPDRTEITTLAVNSAGEAYVAGNTASPDLPATGNAFQPAMRGDVAGFVARLTADGRTLIFATYLDGVSIPVSDVVGVCIDDGEELSALAVDAEGNAYVVGSTTSGTFPTTPNALQPRARGGSAAFDRCSTNREAVVAKLSADGSRLVYGSYLGGANSIEYAYGISVDHAGDAFVVGETSSSDFPLESPFQEHLHDFGYDCGSPCPDAFIAEIAPDGSRLLFSSFLGGYSSDNAAHVAFDEQGGLAVTGVTTSSDFPVTTSIVAGLLNEGWIAHIDLDTSLRAHLTGPAGGVPFHSFAYGTELNWDLTLLNAGVENVTSAKAQTFQVSFLPQGGPSPDLLPVNSEASQGACSANGTCDLGALAAGSTVHVTFKATTDRCGPGAVSPQVTFSQYGRLHVLPVGPEYFAISPRSDIKLDLVSPSTAQFGQTSPLQMTLFNYGPETAEGVRFQITLPQAADLVSLSSTQGNCDSGTASCSIGGLAKGRSVTLTFNVLFHDFGTFPILYSISRQNDCIPPAPGPFFISAKSTTDLGISSDDPLQQTGVPSNLISWHLRVTNHGQQPAKVTVSANRALLQVGNIACSSCSLGLLEPGASRVLTAHFPMHSGTITDQVTISNDYGTDPVPENDSVTLVGIGIPGPPPDFSLQAENTAALDGAAASYKISAAFLGTPTNSQILLACTDLPAAATCSFSPFLLSTGQPSAVLNVRITPALVGRQGATSSLYFAFLVCGIFAGLTRRTRMAAAIGLMLLCLAMLFSVACGGAPAQLTAPAATASPGSPKVVTFNVVGAMGGTQHSIPLSVTVH